MSTIYNVALLRALLAIDYPRGACEVRVNGRIPIRIYTMRLIVDEAAVRLDRLQSLISSYIAGAVGIPGSWGTTEIECAGGVADVAEHLIIRITVPELSVGRMQLDRSMAYIGYTLHRHHSRVTETFATIGMKGVTRVETARPVVIDCRLCEACTECNTERAAVIVHRDLVIERLLHFSRLSTDSRELDAVADSTAQLLGRQLRSKFIVPNRRERDT